MCIGRKRTATRRSDQTWHILITPQRPGIRKHQDDDALVSLFQSIGQEGIVSAAVDVEDHMKPPLETGERAPVDLRRQRAQREEESRYDHIL